jgi:hypothetical protein
MKKESKLIILFLILQSIIGCICILEYFEIKQLYADIDYAKNMVEIERDYNKEFIRSILENKTYVDGGILNITGYFRRYDYEDGYSYVSIISNNTEYNFVNKGHVLQRIGMGGGDIRIDYIINVLGEKVILNYEKIN